MKYAVKIDIDEGKYTVTIKDMAVNNNDETERKSGEEMEFACNASNITFREDALIRKGLFYNHLNLPEKFLTRDPTSNN